MSSSPPPTPKRGRLLLNLVLLAAACAAIVLWYWLRQPNWAATLAANNRGVGHMEQFEYAAAVPEFEEAVRLAPNWLPARINLGIALLNTDPPNHLDRAVEVLREVLRRDPNNPYAHYSLGMIALYRDRLEEAYPEFEAVRRIDPSDAATWFHLGLTHPDGRDSAAAKECFEEALRLNPYFNAARYAVAQHPVGRDPERSRKLLTEHKALFDAVWETPYRIRYSEMGKYADVIGRTSVPTSKFGPLPLFEKADDFKVTLAEGCRWATPDDFGESDEGKVRKNARKRFGAALILLDYDRDGRPDAFLPGAVVENGTIRDLLLHNEDGRGFRDVTAAAGLTRLDGSLGGGAADFDNDGRTDLAVTGLNGLRLLRNVDGARFEDVTAKAGLDAVTGLCLGSAWVDLDQDADLDLVVCRYAPTLAAALTNEPGGELLVYFNAGEAPPGRPNEPQPGLSAAFRRAEGIDALRIKGGMTSVAAADVDGDQDVDLLVMADTAPSLRLILNDRLLRFHTTPANQDEGRWSGVLVLDVAHAQRSDLLLLPWQQEALLVLHRQQESDGEGLDRWFQPADGTRAPLRQAQALDLDLDGWTDVVGLLTPDAPILLHNEAGQLKPRDMAFGQNVPYAAGLAAADIDGDCAPDLLLWTEKDGLQLRHSLGNGNRAVRIELSGRRDKGSDLRTNADGIGAWVLAQAGAAMSSVENTTLSSGLGQSRLPLLLGVGKAERADVVRVRWPDSVPQAELNVPTCEVFKLTELNRKGTSCPVLMAWDGERFRFVTDFLGAGALGETGPDGSLRSPRPEESVKIEPDQLVPRDGQYLLKITEPMDEVLYLDRLRLDVIDHPRELSVYPDERFVTAGPQPGQELLVFRDRILPQTARDDRGRDVLDILCQRDCRFVDGFALRSWLGYAEEHYLELDFSDRMAHLTARDRLFLVLAGWTDYPYPESICAATQAGVALKAPVIERQQPDGTWKAVGDLGFPAGLPRVMTREVTGLLTGPHCVLRLRTNMQIGWDQVYLAPLVEIARPGAGLAKVTPLEVTTASLAVRGFLQEVRPEGKAPISYSDNRTEAVAVTAWRGRLTRTGDVTELLRQTDDRFVLCGPGDEIAVRFDGRELPRLPDGWVRAFVLRTWGYCKDTAPFTRSGGRVGPLPRRGMKSYPDGVGAMPPTQAEYDREWNTRFAGGR